jgi:hypothetical protein
MSAHSHPPTLHGKRKLVLKAPLRLELPMARLLHRAMAIGLDAAAPTVTVPRA